MVLLSCFFHRCNRISNHPGEISLYNVLWPFANGFILVVPLIISEILVPDLFTPTVLVGILGVYLLFCTYAAIGLFMSTLTSYQIIAALGTLTALVC